MKTWLSILFITITVVANGAAEPDQGIEPLAGIRMMGPNYSCTGLAEIDGPYVHVQLMANVYGVNKGERTGFVTITEHESQEEEYTKKVAVTVNLTGQKVTYTSANKKVRLVIDMNRVIPVTPAHGGVVSTAHHGDLSADFPGRNKDIKDASVACFLLYTIRPAAK